MKIILASASPRRAELLAAAGIAFEIEISDAGEVTRPDDPNGTALDNAMLKAGKVADRHPDAAILGADTVIELDGLTLGKPADIRDAARMLGMLSGRAHNVITGVAVIHKASNTAIRFADVSHVVFRKLSGSVINEYLRTVNVLDKAGAYAVQEHGEMLVERVDGLVSNVVGLPVERVAETLRLNGFIR